jgi:carboxylesterase
MLDARASGANRSHMFGRGDIEFFAPGGSPCVVALHGFGGTAAEVRPLLESISSAGYAVDAAVLPGHGTDPKDLQNVTFDDWVAATRARARAAAERHGRFVLLGFSLGSLIAMHLAAEGDSQFPGLVGLVLLGNALRLEPLTSAALAALSRLGSLVPDLYVRKPGPGDLLDKSALAALVTYDRHPLRAAVETYRAGARVRRVVNRITSRALILHGRRDRVCPWSNAVWLADHIGSKDVSVRIYERSGHVLACDFEREEVAREVCAFLDRCAQALPVDP